MADIKDISSIHKDFKTHAELLEYSNKQFIALKKSLEKIAKLENEIRHLQHLLHQTTTLMEDNKVERIIVTPEQALIDEQINILQQRAIGKELTLEEIKKLDLLIKNKKIIDEQAKTLNAKSKKVDIPIISPGQLLEIASHKDVEEDGSA
jgi:hypothetical protein